MKIPHALSVNCSSRLPLAALLIALVIFAQARAAEVQELKVHLTQANNESSYAFVRAKFKPGEVRDPWAVRFVDESGAEVSYFVWDSVTWQVAREGREDWGKRYALINHASGDSDEMRAARGEKISWALENLPELGARLEAEDQTAKANGDSICAALYLLRRTVPAMGRDRLSLRVFPGHQVEPKTRVIEGEEVGERITAQQGGLSLDGLPDQLSVRWKGREILRSAGFNAGGTNSTVSHAEPGRPFRIEISEGIVTKVVLHGQTAWRQDGAMDWQCSYWLFPEGGCVALEGFSLTDPGQYLGGLQTLSVFAMADGVAFAETHKPDWDKPWWMHRAGEGGFVASHLFFATPLTIGFGNHPGTVNTETQGKEPRAELIDGKLGLRWHHEMNDPNIARLSTLDAVMIRNGHLAAADTPATRPSWKPKIDWVYRQYVLGIGENEGDAETAMRGPLGAAAGWIDRPVSEEETAALLVSMARNIGAGGQSGEIGLLKIVPAVLNDDAAAIQNTQRDRLLDYVGRSDQYITALRANVANGGHPAAGSKLMPDGSRVEGWTGNPCYHASLMPTDARVREFFEQAPALEQNRDAILHFADTGLELLGGDPVDFEKLRANLESQWPSHVVPTIPLMLHAYSLKPDDRYFQTARLLFEDLLKLAERNPHGYFPAWSWTPGADKYDTVYNPVSYDRGITAIWYEDARDRIGVEATSRFTAAQARWFVYSGQLLDTFETDSVTAIRACNHGGHTNLRNQIGLYLYDDFAFYRGLLGDLVAWSAASNQVPGPVDRSGTGAYRQLILSNGGSTMVRWAFDIRAGNRWLESKVSLLATGNGFSLRAWNRLPLAQPKFTVTAKEAGLSGDSPVLEAQLLGPAYREPAEFEVKRKGDLVQVKASRAAKIRVFASALCPDWPLPAKLALMQDGSAVERSVLAADGSAEWRVEPGEYQLTVSGS